MLFALRKLVHLTYRPLLLWYLSKRRKYRLGSTRLEIDPGVFHPGFFKTTHVLLEYLQQVDLKGRKLLELGCGSGLIAIEAAKKGATVMASDINPFAVENARRNMALNRVRAVVVQSDLFAQIPETTFDYIIINPPFYPSDPKNDGERAWYCGSGHEYFDRLFSQMTRFSLLHTKVLMVLSSDCEMTEIQLLLKKHKLNMREVYCKKFLFERNTVYLFH